jgi:predicted RNA-binding protein with PUA-like domain
MDQVSPTFTKEEIMSNRYWLIKSEPTSYSIDDLKRDKTTLWEGVRNYQARNFMMNGMKVGDLAIFYHSNAEPPAAVGVAEISDPAEPDPTQFESSDDHYDPRATPGKPIWYCVRVKFKQKFGREVTLSEMKEEKGLEKMVLLQKGSRLSVQPVTAKEFKIVSELGSNKSAGKGKARE